jgi:hypothetical protein
MRFAPSSSLFRGAAADFATTRERDRGLRVTCFIADSSRAIDRRLIKETDSFGDSVLVIDEGVRGSEGATVGGTWTILNYRACGRPPVIHGAAGYSWLLPSGALFSRGVPSAGLHSRGRNFIGCA